MNWLQDATRKACYQTDNEYFYQKLNKMIDAGFKIKMLREQQHLSQAELSHYLGVSQTTLSNIENGVTHSLDLEFMDKVCKKFKVGFEYFLGGEQHNSVDNNNGGTGIVGNNYGTINNTPDSVLEQVTKLVEEHKLKEAQIRKLQSEIESIKKRH